MTLPDDVITPDLVERDTPIDTPKPDPARPWFDDDDEDDYERAS